MPTVTSNGQALALAIELAKEGMQQALDILTAEQEAHGTKSAHGELLAIIGLNGAIQNELLLAIATGLHCLVDGEVEGAEVPN